MHSLAEIGADQAGESAQGQRRRSGGERFNLLGTQGAIPDRNLIHQSDITEPATRLSSQSEIVEVCQGIAAARLMEEGAILPDLLLLPTLEKDIVVPTTAPAGGVGLGLGNSRGGTTAVAALPGVPIDDGVTPRHVSLGRAGAGPIGVLLKPEHGRWGGLTGSSPDPQAYSQGIIARGRVKDSFRGRWDRDSSASRTKIQSAIARPAGEPTLVGRECGAADLTVMPETADLIGLGRVGHRIEIPIAE